MPLLQLALNTNPTPYNKEPDLNVVGEALLAVSGPEGAASESSSVVRPSNDQISLYTVREGDTLSSIANLFNVTVNTIRWANDLNSGSTIKKGQVLIILPISGVKYTVKKGDTVQSIAKSYGGDVGEINSFNNLEVGQKLSVGDEVVIPDGELSSGVQTSSENSSNGSKTTVTKSGKTTAGPTSGTYIDSSGYFRRPLDGGVRTQGIHGHNGVDWGSPVGTPIHAAASGQVIISKNSGWNGGYGDYVVISHPNGTQTLYAHMSKTAVSGGANVEKGEVIGYIGLTGETTGPHVHFEVRGAKNPF